jgi:hypothetical protein
VPARERRTVPARERRTVPARERRTVPAPERRTVPAPERSSLRRHKSCPSRRRPFRRKRPRSRRHMERTGGPSRPHSARQRCSTANDRSEDEVSGLQAAARHATATRHPTGTYLGCHGLHALASPVAVLGGNVNTLLLGVAARRVLDVLVALLANAPHAGRSALRRRLIAVGQGGRGERRDDHGAGKHGCSGERGRASRRPRACARCGGRWRAARRGACYIYCAARQGERSMGQSFAIAQCTVRVRYARPVVPAGATESTS